MFSLRSIVADLPRRLEVYDIGARIEGEPRYASLIQHWPASVTAFEPQKSELDQLESLGPHVRLLPYTLGDGSTATFHVTRWPGNCSLFEPDPSVIDCFCGIGAAAIDANFHVVRTENVRTFRLDDLEGHSDLSPFFSESRQTRGINEPAMSSDSDRVCTDATKTPPQG